MGKKKKKINLKKINLKKISAVFAALDPLLYS
jgi:hypothetical protein